MLDRNTLIVQFANLLHKHDDPKAPAVVAFIQKHQDDPVLRDRMNTLLRLRLLRDSQ